MIFGKFLQTEQSVLLGEENSMLIDLVRRLQGNCDGYAGVRRVDH